jgi:hypothetical protein
MSQQLVCYDPSGTNQLSFVTEGKLVKRGVKSITTPAKVELLLDDDSLSEVAGPLVEFLLETETHFWAFKLLKKR